MKDRDFEADYEKALRQLEELPEKVQDANKKRLWELGLSITGDAAKDTPQDTSNLRRSYWVGVRDKFNFRGGASNAAGEKSREILATRKAEFKRADEKDSSVLWVGNSANYAAEVNNTPKNYRVGRAGFFTDAIFSNVKKFLKASKEGWKDAERKS